MNEEQWSLREVVFVEDVKNVPVGKVCSKYIRVNLPPELEQYWLSRNLRLVSVHPCPQSCSVYHFQ